jgi:hypothetical protein
MVPIVLTNDFCLTEVLEVRSGIQSSLEEKTKESVSGLARLVGRHDTGNVCHNEFLPLQGPSLSRAGLQVSKHPSTVKTTSTPPENVGLQPECLAVTNTHATIEELLEASFSTWPLSCQGK